jgi:hypothetical protein
MVIPIRLIVDNALGAPEPAEGWQQLVMTPEKEKQFRDTLLQMKASFQNAGFSISSSSPPANKPSKFSVWDSFVGGIVKRFDTEEERITRAVHRLARRADRGHPIKARRVHHHRRSRIADVRSLERDGDEESRRARTYDHARRSDRDELRHRPRAGVLHARAE